MALLIPHRLNRDYHVSFTLDERENGRAYYNYTPGPFGVPEGPGVSAFYSDDDGAIYHTYSTYVRGRDMVNGAYHVLDLAPKGRDEAGLSSYDPPPVVIANLLSKRS